MSTFTNSLASSLLASSILISGGVTPVLAQYSCPSREIQSVDEVGDFKFELQGCQRLGKKVTCQAWATNTKRDNLQCFEQKTRLVDTAGEVYVSSSIQPTCIKLVKDVPIKVSASFMEVPISVQDIALLEVSTIETRGQFRNFKITESKMGNSSSPIKKKK